MLDDKCGFLESSHAAKWNLDFFLMAFAALSRGLNVHYFPKSKKFHVLGFGKKVVFRNSGEIEKSSGAIALCKDKNISGQVFESHSVPKPFGFSLSHYENYSFEDAMEKLRYPGSIVVKPAKGSQGKGVSCGINDSDGFQDAVKYARSISKEIVVEEFVTGVEARCYVVGESVVGATARVPPYIVGDGSSNILDLIKSKNIARRKNPHLSSRPIPIDGRLRAFLEKMSRELTDVPSEGETLYLSGTANFSMGGESEDITNELPEWVRLGAVKAVKSLGLMHAGVDVIFKKGGDGGGRVWIIEVNSQANIGSHAFPLKGGAVNNNVADAIISYHFPLSVKKEKCFFDYSPLIGLGNNFFLDYVSISSGNGSDCDFEYFYKFKIIVSSVLVEVDASAWVRDKIFDKVIGDPEVVVEESGFTVEILCNRENFNCIVSSLSEGDRRVFINSISIERVA